MHVFFVDGNVCPVILFIFWWNKINKIKYQTNVFENGPLKFCAWDGKHKKVFANNLTEIAFLSNRSQIYKASTLFLNALTNLLCFQGCNENQWHFL